MSVSDCPNVDISAAVARNKIMKDTDKTVDPLPDSFESEQAAGEFWDSHSTMDYQEHLEATDDTIRINEPFSSTSCGGR